MPTDLVWEHGCVGNAEALDAKHAELRVDDTGLRRSANTCGGRLQNLAVSSYEEQNRSGGKGAVGRQGEIRRPGRTGWNAPLQWLRMYSLISSSVICSEVRITLSW